MEERSKAWAIISLVCGIVGCLVVVCCGMFGTPFALVSSIAGLVTGGIGIRSNLRGVAIGGLVMNTLAFTLGALVLALNVWLVDSGKHPFFPDGWEGGIQLPDPPRRPRAPAPGAPETPAAPAGPVAPETPVAPDPAPPGSSRPPELLPWSDDEEVEGNRGDERGSER
jgi:hypothetical protein